MRPDEEFPLLPGHVLEPPRRRIAWVTWFLLSSTLIVFLFQLHFQQAGGEDPLGGELAFSSTAMTEGRYWTVLTYAWAHAVEMFGEPGFFWLHIAANMILLVCLGPALEEFLGHACYLGLYLGGAVAAALVWYFFNQQGDQGIIGASGAIFALIAAAGTAAPRASVVVYVLFVLPIRMSLLVFAIVVCGAEAAQILFHWLPAVAHSAHLGGAAFGVLYVLAVRSWRRFRLAR